MNWGGARRLILEACYPIGSYFINRDEAFNTVEKVTAYMGFGTWIKVPDGTFLEAGSTITNHEAGLPNIKGQVRVANTTANAGLGTQASASGAMTLSPATSSKYKTFADSSGNYNVHHYILFNANSSNSIYGNSSTVQPKSQTAYCYYREK